jgi:hypothetical protein
MTAIAAAVWKTSMKMQAMTMGPAGASGATIKVVKVTPATTNYSAGGVTLDLSTAGPLGSAGFKRRIYWAVPMNPTAVDASTGFLQHGYVPGTAKTDAPGGFSPTDGKYVMSTGATEMTASDQSAHALYYVVCGT